METFYAVVLGIIQGLTEFLPVSSSGHLVLMQNLFGFEEPEILFDISLHVGTLAAICIVFFKEIQSILLTLAHFPALMKSAGGMGALFAENDDVKIVVLIFVGSIPTALLGILFSKIADRIFGAVWIVGIMLLVTGTFLWLTRRVRRKGRNLNGLTIKDALMIGLVQGMAILPGISRSGSTISAALFLGIDREVAGRYSFLLSIPAIVGALMMGLDSSAIRSTVPVRAMLLGTVAAGVIGFVALKILLIVVKQGRLYRFAPYCWVVGLAALTIG